MNLSPPSDQALNTFMVVVCSLGAIINGAMLGVSVRRRAKLKHTVNPVAERIARLTLRRATRIELGFLVCQLARLFHTIWFFGQLRPTDPNGSSWVFFFAVVERSFVTAMLVYLSVWDLFDRHRIARLLYTARSDDWTGTGLSNLLGDVKKVKVK